jgi:hypothetical protein
MSDIANVMGGAVSTDVPDAANGYDVLPAGWYTVYADKAEVKNNKAGNGCYLKMELTVIGENYNGRKLFPMINLQNPSAKAVGIGRRELAALGQACGLAAIQDSKEVIGKYFQVRVKVEKGNGNYDDDNRVTAYKPSDGQPQPQAQQPPPFPAQASAQPPAQPPQPQAQAPQQATPPPAAGKRPWER